MNGLRELLGLPGPDLPVYPPAHRSEDRRAQGPTVDPALVNRRRAANRRARASRRINRRRSR